MTEVLANLLTLSRAEQLQVLEDLWDHIAANPDEVPIHQWHKDELDRRAALPQTGESWDVVKARIRSGHGR